MEAFGLVLIAFLAYFLNQRSQGASTALSVIGVFALGAQRLLPSLQQGYAAWDSIVGSQASLADTIRLLDQEIVYEKTHTVIEPLIFEDKINFNNVRFKYKHDGPWILDDVSFSIRKGMRVGIVGSTGSGKSTLLDLFMGLLENNEGRISVDGKSIKGLELLSWQKLVAHVPQTIYLTDASLAENIAFGIPKEEIDWQRIHTVARQAQISEFIESTLEGYQAKVGERGVRLSGGQRQRIGIARALYTDPKLLILDEATSSVDGETELAISTALHNLGDDVTVIVIAHRLSTVRSASQVIYIEEGKILAKGSFEEVRRQISNFDKQAKLMGL
jgi:ATP-binding cassette subfamily B protein